MKPKPKKWQARKRLISEKFVSVMQALDAVGNAPRFSDPILEQLQQCPEAFTAGEMVGKMFDTLRYDSDDWQGGDRLLPPAGLVMPLV
jgi:hypothetical protein